MKIYITPETAEEVTMESLKEAHESLEESIEQTLSGEDFVAMYSFDIDEEIFKLVRLLDAIELTANYYGADLKSTVLQEHNKDIYSAYKKFKDLQEDFEEVVRERNMLQEELDEIRDNVLKLIKIKD